MTGKSFSVADITTICVIDIGNAMEMKIPTSVLNVERWCSKLQERERVQKSNAIHMPYGSMII